MAKHYLFAPGFSAPVDKAVRGIDGTWRSRFTGQSLMELAKDYPGLQVVDADELELLQAEASRTDPQQISEADYLDALALLRPQQFMRDEVGESFKLGEGYVADVTDIYVCLHGPGKLHTYWRFRDDFRMAHGDIIARVNALPNRQNISNR